MLHSYCGMWRSDEDPQEKELARRERESSLLLYVAPALRPRGGGRAGGMKYLVNGEDSAQ